MSHLFISALYRAILSFLNLWVSSKSDSWFNLFSQDYEPTGETPMRSELEIPSKGMIESLRTMPMEALLEEFRENHPDDPSKQQPIKHSLIPRSPLTQRNWHPSR